MSNIGYHHWTGREVKYVRENYGKLTSKQIADYIGVYPSVVKNLIARMHIVKVDNPPMGWSREQYDTLVKEFKNCKSVKELSKRIKKPIRSVYKMAYSKGLYRCKKV